MERRSLRSTHALLLGLCAWFGACRTSHEVAPAGLAAAQPIRLSVARTWDVHDGEQLVGWVVHYVGAPSGDAPRPAYFSVQNRLQQELGRVDGLGRAWRFEPHSAEPVWLTTGTVSEGVRAILRLDARAQLIESPLSDEHVARD